MNPERTLIRGALVLAAAIVLGVAVVAITEEGGRSQQAWAAIAAAMAVLAAITSAWTSQRVVELQETALEPNVVVSFDFRSRYQLAQLRISNRGGSPAYDVRIDWQTPLKTTENKDVSILGPSGVLPILSPKDDASVLLGQSQAFLNANQQTVWTGTITYRVGTGGTRTMPLMLSAEHERWSLLHNLEDQRTHYELQQIPDRLQTISNELSDIRKAISR